MSDVQQQPGTTRAPGAAQQTPPGDLARARRLGPVPAMTVAAISAAHGRELTDQT